MSLNCLSCSYSRTDSLRATRGFNNNVADNENGNGEKPRFFNLRRQTEVNENDNGEKPRFFNLRRQTEVNENDNGEKPRFFNLRRQTEVNENENGEKSRFFSRRQAEVNRSWSGNLVPRPLTRSSAPTTPRLGVVVEGGDIQISSNAVVVPTLPHRRHSGPIECEAPRLVRSCGMRRDWSFEDLRQQKVKV